MHGPDGPVRGRAVQRRRLALLALLACARGRTTGREKLIGLLWPEHGGDAARHLLSESLYVLRKLLGDGAFVSVGDEVGLAEGVLVCDAVRLQEAAEHGEFSAVVCLYAGPFMDGFYLSSADEFERWCEAERMRLARIHTDALERLAVIAEGERKYLQAAEWWRRLNEHEPYSSRIVLRLMRVLEYGGEHLAALRTARDHALFLREEMGAEPDPAVPEYAERLRTAPSAGSVPRRLSGLPPALADSSTQPDPEGESRVVLPHASGGAGATVSDAAPTTFDEYLPELSPPLGTRDARPHGDGGLGAVAASADSSRPRSWHQRAALLFSITALVGVGYVATRSPDPHASSAAVRVTEDPHRIAVLYFDDHSEKQNLGYIANGLTERLISDLAQVRGLYIISRNGVKPFRDGTVPLDTIVARLHAGTLVEGSVERSGDRLRVTVQLIDGGDGAHLESTMLEQPITELFRLEDDIADHVSGFLRKRLGTEIRLRERRSGTRDTIARERLMRAEELRDQAAQAAAAASPLKRETARGMLASAETLLREAVTRDPKWVNAWIDLGWTSLERAELVTEPGRDVGFDTALRCVDHALGLAANDPGALELRGTVRWRMVQVGAALPADSAAALSAQAERDLNRALAQEPSLARAWLTLSQLLRVQHGRLAEADVAARRALDADEFLLEAPLVIERLYRSSLQLARWDTAAAWCQRGRDRYPDDWRFLECRLTLLTYDGEHPDLELARRLYRELEQVDPPDAAMREGRGYTPAFRKMQVAKVAARAGESRDAHALADSAWREVRGNRELEASYYGDLAYLYLLLGDRDTAIVTLQRHLDRSPRLRAQIARDVRFRALRGDPRFRRLVVEPPESVRGHPTGMNW